MSGTGSASAEATFVFADIAGYTALTESHGDDLAVRVVEEFCGHARRLLERHGGEEVKAIGDAMMLRVEEPAAAVQIGIDLAHHEMRTHEHPAVRVGMHHGSAVERGGDWFGGAVNLAARVAALAQSGEVVVTAATKEAAGELEGIAFRKRGVERLRNVREPVPLYTAICFDAGTELVTDPVCRMLLDPGRSHAETVHGGRVYTFCSDECRAAFTNEPDFYAARAPA
jgi:class 3 adenylate cyclase/YHS domain-containing protein